MYFLYFKIYIYIYIYVCVGLIVNINIYLNNSPFIYFKAKM